MSEIMPYDLIAEILRRLPVKYLLRCRCVCKLWCAITKERSFIDKHRTGCKEIFVYKDFLCYLLEDFTKEKYKYITTKHGLLLGKNTSSDSSDTYLIRNPMTKQVLYLPRPSDHDWSDMRIIYLRNIDTYKLACFYPKKGTKEFVGGRVLTIGTDLNWRSLDIPSCSKKLGIGDIKGEFDLMEIDNVVFIFRHGYCELIRIEMESESITTVMIPQDLFSDWNDVRPLPYNDDAMFCLAKFEDEKINVQVLQNGKKEKWVGEKMDILSKSMRKYPNMMNLRNYHLNEYWLWIYANEDYLYAYDVRAKRRRIEKCDLSRKTLVYILNPSLVHLPGMQGKN
ncbi:hypothetical protein ACH5RR_017640 [Cinchona calisaya]|uniref:F-box domain-containing protein n=1 Tax=Cinchona calisaya TaxID=153742 RepID=A0ABD2ZKW3_9GENT